MTERDETGAFWRDIMKKRGGLWKYREGKSKYLVQRRDGTVPEWPYFVLGARDPAVPETLRFYADACEARGYHQDYVADVRQMADDFEACLAERGAGDPDAVRHRQDDPEIIVKMQGARGA